MKEYQSTIESLAKISKSNVFREGPFFEQTCKRIGISPELVDRVVITNAKQGLIDVFTRATTEPIRCTVTF